MNAVTAFLRDDGGVEGLEYAAMIAMLVVVLAGVAVLLVQAVAAGFESLG